MKQNSILFLIAVVCLSISCEEVPGGDENTPNCEYDNQENISFINFGLKVPEYTGTFFDNVFGINYASSDRTIYFLTQVLETGKFDTTSNSKMPENTPEDIYGETIQYGFNNSKGSMNKNSGKELYIPKKLNISKPLPFEDDIFIYAFYKDFKLEWNADPKNKEGLMVAVMYDGSNVIPENDENVIIKNIDHIEEDNGKIILNNSIFDDIPNHALVDIMLLRGNVEIEEYDDETYKIFAESHQTISLVLIREGYEHCD